MSSSEFIVSSLMIVMSRSSMPSLISIVLVGIESSITAYREFFESLMKS